VIPVIGLQHREGDEADDRGGGHEERVAHLPAEEDDKASECNERGAPSRRAVLL
jgi:hypothetical protein